MELLVLEKNEELVCYAQETNKLFHKNKKNSSVKIQTESLIKSLNNLDEKEIKNITIENETLTIELSKFKIVLMNYDYLVSVYPLKSFNKKVMQLNDKLHTQEKLKKNKKKKVYRLNRRGKAIVLTTLVLAGILVGKNSDHSKDLKNQAVPIVPTTSTVENYEINAEPIANNITKEINIPEADAFVCNIQYEDRSNTEKALNVSNNCLEIIKKYASIYGVDEKIILGIATQERSEHATYIDTGGSIGQMQIEYDTWVGNNVTAYNFATEQYETVTVDGEKLKDLDYNIKIGCMIYCSYLQEMDYNILVTIQSYNMGTGSMYKILNKYGESSGKTMEEILASNDIGWLDYRGVIDYGDPNYLEHVLSWIGDSNELCCYKTDGSEIMVNVNPKEAASIL